MNFDQAFTVLLGHEGKFTYNPSDPGGATCWGVTQAVARANGYDGDMRDYPQDEAKRVFKKSYWDAARADELPDGVRFDVFDGAVNSGVPQSIKWLQRAASVTDDGALGPITLAAVNALNGFELKAKYNGNRLLFMSGLPIWPAFGRGWARRIAENLKGA